MKSHIPSSDPTALSRYRRILKMRVDATSYVDATQLILNWAAHREHRYVCAANVHMAMEVYDSDKFAGVVNHADLVTPDGMPLVWALRWLGISNAERVYGPTLTLRVCEAATKQQIPIGLYGGTTESLADFASFLQSHSPGIEIACEIAPPFRPLTAAEDVVYTQQIIDSGAQILFVGIGCPKQEYWMAARVDRLPCVMLGVGAAFDFHSGRVKQAPAWMQWRGLEWLFRLMQEPQRLWKRYLYNNPRFIIFLAQQLITNWIDRHLLKKHSQSQ